MDFGVRSRLTVRRPRSQLRTGWVYARHTLRFEIVHPLVFGLALLQIVLSIGLFAGVSAVVFVAGPFSLERAFAVSTILSYLFTSITTVVINGTIAGYVLAAELGVPRPLSRAVGQVRARLATLVGYAVVWASVVTLFVVLDRLTVVGVLVEPLNLALQVVVFGTNLAWSVGTIFVVPILVFGPTTSLRGAIGRSVSFLQESVCCLLVFWAVSAVIFLLIAGGGVAVLVLASGPLALASPVVAVCTGATLCYTLSTVFTSLLYGEVAGPLDVDSSRKG